MYGSGLKTSVQLTSYTFEVSNIEPFKLKCKLIFNSFYVQLKVCDSYVNIAPIGSMTIGERGVDENDETKLEPVEESGEKPELEIVTSSGRGKNGALCILQHSIKPVMLTFIQFPGKFKQLLASFSSE